MRRVLNTPLSDWGRGRRVDLGRMLGEKSARSITLRNDSLVVNYFM